MRYPSRLFVPVLCLFAYLAVSSPARAQAPTVYFSTGSTNPSQIYSLDTTSSATNLLVSTSGADYEGLVVLPDNTGTYPFLVYACNTAGDQIVRFNPAATTPITPEVVYSGQGLYPQCGRGTSKGDLIFSSTAKGKTGGWWELAGIAGQGLGSKSLPSATQLFQAAANSSSLYQGMAMKNIGDLLIVDQANNQVLRSPGPISDQFTTATPYTNKTTDIPPLSPFITTGLSSPKGIARATTGEVFIANQSSGTVAKFDATGQSEMPLCVSFNANYTPYFMQMGLDNTLYIGATKNSKGEVLVVDAATCTQTNSFVPGVPVVGIALSPSVAVNVPAQSTMNNDGTFTHSFAVGDSSIFEVTTGACANPPTATATETAPFGNVPAHSTSGPISGLIGEIPGADLPYGGTPAVDLWADGFEIVYSAQFDNTSPANCQQVGGTGGYEETISSFVDPSQVTSGAIAYCDNTLNSGGCDTLTLLGAYPLGGLLPADYTSSGRTNSQFFLINATPAQARAQFCGYQSPFSSSNGAPYNPAPPYIAGVFSSGSTISVKFKLATSGGNCKNGPYIQTAQALISVAQLCTPGSASPDLICSLKGQMPLVPSNLVVLEPEGNSTPTPPIYKFGNNQYQFSLSLKGYPPGIYSLTTTFETGETTNQTILFQVQ